MTKYREILRLKSLGFSERNIAQSCGVSRNTVAKVLKKAAEINFSWPLDFDMTDSALEELMFPKDKSATNKRMPNFDIHPQRTSAERRKQKASLGRILRGVPHEQRRASNVFSVLLLYPEG